MSTAATAGHEEHTGLDGGPCIDRVRAYDLELPYPNPLRPAWRPGLVSHGRRFSFVAVDADGLTGYAGADGHQCRWGFQRDAVPAYASTCEVGTPEERAALAGHYRALRCRAMKLRFHADTLEGDLALLDAVRDAEPDLELMVDANQATELSSPEQGAGGEYNRGLHEFRWLVERGVYDIVQADGTVSEAVSQTRKVAALAELHQRRFVPHHGLSGLGLAATLHLACCLPHETWLEVMYEPRTRTFEAYQQLGGILTTRIEAAADGLARPPAAPGVGVQVDESALDRVRAQP